RDLPFCAEPGHLNVFRFHDVGADALPLLAELRAIDAEKMPGVAIIYALIDQQRSGAGIAWDFFHPGVPRPALVNHVEDRDLWRFALPGTREIQAAVFSRPYTFAAWD